jgi:hypothetical protein
MRFWPEWWSEGGALVASFVSVALLLYFSRPGFDLSPPPAGAPPLGQPWHEKLIDWERDRILMAAKGTGSTAAGFLTALVAAVLKNDIKDNVSTFTVIGCIAGAVGALVLASNMSANTRHFVETYGP